MPFHVLTGSFVHESNTFKKGETTLQDFRDGVLDLGQVALDRFGDVNDELAGFLDAGREAGWRITHSVSAHANPGARVCARGVRSSGGDHLRRRRGSIGPRWTESFCRCTGPWSPAFCEDGEGELLRRLRAIVGPDLPIAVTLDLHAMVTQAMVDQAQILVSYKTYPHVDMRVTGRHAARLLDATMRGEIRPRTLRLGLPMLDEANAGRTDVPETAALYDRAAAHEAEPGILAVSINAAFAEADIREAGPTVLVTHDDAAASRAEAIALGLAQTIWDQRASVSNEFLTPEAAAAEALGFDASRGPLVIADYADNPGAGAYGDATALLAALLTGGGDGWCAGADDRPRGGGVPAPAPGWRYRQSGFGWQERPFARGAGRCS
jgi:microcystin degradation protein MlrC